MDAHSPGTPADLLTRLAELEARVERLESGRVVPPTWTRHHVELEAALASLGRTLEREGILRSNPRKF